MPLAPNRTLLRVIVVMCLLVILFTLDANFSLHPPLAPIPIKEESFKRIFTKFNSSSDDRKMAGASKQSKIESSSFHVKERGVQRLPQNGTRLAAVDSKSGLGEATTVEDQGNGHVCLKISKVEKQKLFPCNDVSTLVSSLGQRGSFWVLYNYVTPTLRFSCDESVTYTTHADYTYLDNLVPLLQRWQGPISLSLYTPGTDYYETLLRIHYLRQCSPLVRDLVTFHLFFDNKQIPENLSSTAESLFDKMLPVNCSKAPSFGPNVTTFRKSRNLLYPINTGRNVAREMASTYFVLASDIELYPNPNLIPVFLEMIHRDWNKLLKSPNPKVFVLPLFEVSATVSVLPIDKTDLQKMLKERLAYLFRVKICPKCHEVPKQEEWLKANMTQGLHVFSVGKRRGPQRLWEPIYIGTKSEPIYDERLTWEGRGDKMVQGHVLCLLDYEFHVLDNAFFVHRPGIKKRVNYSKNPAVIQQHQLVTEVIEPEIKLLYGSRPGCFMFSRRKG